MPTSSPFWQDWHFWVGIGQYFFLPFALWLMKHFIGIMDRRADVLAIKRANEVKKDLDLKFDRVDRQLSAHEVSDNSRFEIAAAQTHTILQRMDHLEDVRQIQHKENVQRLDAINDRSQRTEATVEQLMRWNQEWVRSKL